MSEVDGKHVITINGTAHDNSEIEYFIFQVSSDYWDQSRPLDGATINENGEFTFTHEFKDVTNPSTIEAYAVYAFDEFGNGSHQILADRYTSVSYRRNLDTLNESSSSDGTAIFAYLVTGRRDPGLGNLYLI